ncbi:hypothetical protein R1flu_000227 [Riccia fluitans]|uniref:EF-hand domain-containing protein n=1 Tax=Riccia fluitans TaxID=41844 RepID=A0ABD1XZV8_9MARC
MADFQSVYPTFLVSDVASWYNSNDSAWYYQATAEQTFDDSAWFYQALAEQPICLPFDDFPNLEEVRPTTSTSTVLSGFNITPDVSEMKRVFDKFNHHGDGLIGSQDLRRFMSRLGYHLTQDEAQQMLESVDRNQEGRVNFDQFLFLYRSLCDGEDTISSITTASTPTTSSGALASSPTSNSDMEVERISAFEDDSSTLLTSNLELKVEKFSTFEDDTTLLEAFRMFDKNQDGVITAEELQSVLLDLGMPGGRSLRSCEQMIESVDADGNGVIDIAEFRELMTTSFAFC